MPLNRQPGRPEPRPVDRGPKQINKGRLIFREQFAFEARSPQGDKPGQQLGHKGGLGDARTEHY